MTNVSYMKSIQQLMTQLWLSIAFLSIIANISRQNRAYSVQYFQNFIVENFVFTPLIYKLRLVYRT